MNIISGDGFMLDLNFNYVMIIVFGSAWAKPDG